MRRIKIALLISSFFIGAVIIAFSLYLKDEKPITNIIFACQADANTTENISLYCDDDCCYAFLPSYADFKTLHIKCLSLSRQIYIDNKKYNSDSDCSELLTDKSYNLII